MPQVSSGAMKADRSVVSTRLAGSFGPAGPVPMSDPEFSQLQINAVNDANMIPYMNLPYMVASF